MGSIEAELYTESSQYFLILKNLLKIKKGERCNKYIFFNPFLMACDLRTIGNPHTELG